MKNNLANFEDIPILHQLYMQAPIAIGVYLGKEHIIEFANPLMCKIWGRKKEQVINKPLFEALPEAANQGYEEILAGVLESRRPFEGAEMPATLERGGNIDLAYFNILYNPMFGASDEVIGVIQIASEVTDLVKARKKAERNEEVLNFALESGKIGTWYVDLVKGLTERSDQHDAIFGYKTQLKSWTVDTFFEHVIPEDLGTAREDFESGLKNEFFHSKVRIRWPDKSIHWVEVKGKTSYNLKRTPISIAGIVMDVTEQKLIEEKERRMDLENIALKEAKRQKEVLEQLFMEAPALICTLIGQDHVYDFVNPLYQKQISPLKKLKGLSVLEAMPELEGQPIIDILNGVYETGKAFVGNEVPLQLNRQNKGNLDTLYFNFIYQPHYNSEGNIIGILVFAFEVTEQIHAKSLVEKSEENLQLALEAGKMGTWHLDLKNDIAVHSLKHDNIFGYESPVKEWGFKNFIAHVVPEDRKYVQEQFRLSEKTEELNLETRILTVDNKLKWIAVKGKVLYENGEPERMAGIVMDVSSRKKAEEEFKDLTKALARSNEELIAANDEIKAHLEELSKSNNQLKHINADLDNFIYTASHDLKAPISNIEGLMNLLVRNLSEDNKEKEVVKKVMSSIETSVGRFKKTISELADIAKLQKEDDDVSELNINEVVDDVLLDLETMIDHTGAEVRIFIRNCPNIKFSHKNLKSVIYNLLSNAIKYRAQDRSPKVTLSCSTSKGKCLVFEVSDNGLGIKQKDINKIFSMYKRLHTHVEGTGVGLYLVKRIIDNAHGKVVVESEENIGSTFKVFLPIA